jgi:hypothetical protein
LLTRLRQKNSATKTNNGSSKKKFNTDEDSEYAVCSTSILEEDRDYFAPDDDAQNEWSQKSLKQTYQRQRGGGSSVAVQQYFLNKETHSDTTDSETSSPVSERSSRLAEF